MERIERDLSEISTLRSTLQDDREYTTRLRTSLQDETVRLRELQTKILTQVIHNPPESLLPIAAAQSRPRLPDNKQANSSASDTTANATGNNNQRAPEIIVPGSGASASRNARDSKSSGAARPTKAKRTGTPVRDRTDDNDGPADESFDFTFVQK